MDPEHVIYSWSAQRGLDPLRVAGGEGCWFWDDRGRRYLDFASQVVNLNLGHQHPRLVEAVRRQAGALRGLAPSFASTPRSELARLLAEVTPVDLSLTLFTTGGADANENAVKLARWVTGRRRSSPVSEPPRATAAPRRSPATRGAGRRSPPCRGSCACPTVSVPRLRGSQYDRHRADAFDRAAGHAKTAP